MLNEKIYSELIRTKSRILLIAADRVNKSNRMVSKKKWFKIDQHKQGKDSVSPSAKLFALFSVSPPPPPIGGVTVWDMCAAYFPSTPTSPASCGCRVGVALEIRSLVIRGSSDANRRHEASPVVVASPLSAGLKRLEQQQKLFSGFSFWTVFMCVAKPLAMQLYPESVKCTPSCFMRDFNAAAYSGIPMQAGIVSFTTSGTEMRSMRVVDEI